MARIGFASAAYGRDEYGLPEARLVNLFVEATPGGPGEDARLPRPGLELSSTVGDGPIRGMFRAAGVFGGDLFAASGGRLFRGGADIGSAAGGGSARFAASSTQLVMTAGGAAQIYDGAILTPILMPDLVAVSDVAFLAGRFVYVQAGSDRFFWSDIADAATVNGLAFATAEGSPDPIVGAAVLGDELYLFGGATIEVWDATGDADTPFQRSAAKRLARGCGSQRSIVVMDNGAFWLGDDGIIYRTGPVPNRLSNHGIEARLRRCPALADVTAFGAVAEGHSFYVVNVPQEGSFALDLASGQWAEWRSHQRSAFRCQTSVAEGGLLGDGLSGDVWSLTPGRFKDGDDPIAYLASAYAPLEGPAQRCDSAVLQGARGVGLETGQGSDPVAELRYSDDLGRTWSDWRHASLGMMGRYSRRAAWRRLGLMREPGRAFEVRTTDPVLATMSALLLNEARAHG